MAQPVCLISGVGPGTGSALVRRFAAEGYRVAMLARNAQRLAALSEQVSSAGPMSVTSPIIRRSMLRWRLSSARWALPAC